MKRVLVTGATGYIGYHLAKRLLEGGYEAHVLVRPSSTVSRLVTLERKPVIHRYDGSIDNMLAIMTSTGPEVVFHLAGISCGEHRPEEVKALIEANVLLGAMLVEAMARSGVQMLVNTGTYWECGIDGSYAPNSLYAATKRALDDIVVYYVRCESIKAVTLRLFDVYGPADWRGKVISRMQVAARGDQVLRMSGGEQLLDLVYIDDVVSAYMRGASLLLESGSVGGPVNWAVRTGRRMTLREVAGLFERISGARLRIEWGRIPYPKGTIFSPWLGEPLPGWSPLITLEEGLQRVIKADTGAPLG